MGTEDDAAPPPPPLSPPPAQEETTIGKYIARFRYDKPQPREARAAAQRSDFWWTKSPRYIRSPSPPSPSTWASGAFAFPDDEEEEEISEELNESKEQNLSADEESVESKWRQRLGLSSSDLEQGINDMKGSELNDARPPVLQLWSSEGWGDVDLDEEEEEMEEDPEKVIERVRRRLNWGSAPGKNNSTPTRIKAMGLPLVINTDRRQLWTKPPLSPGFKKEDTRDSFDCSSRGTTERDFGDDQFVKTSMENGDAKDVVRNGYKEEKNRVFDEMKTTHRQSERSEEESETKSVHSESLRTDVAALGMRFGNSSVTSHSSQKSEEFNDVSIESLDENNEEGPATTHFDAADENNTVIDKLEEKMRPDEVPQVPKLPQLPPRSPARPNFALDLEISSPDYNPSVCSQDSTSSSVQRASETAKTLDNLVSLVVHSWESDFFSPSRHEDTSTINGQLEQATGEDLGDTRVLEAPVSPGAKISSPVGDLNEENETTTIQDPTATEISADVFIHKAMQDDPDEEETESSEVPGEEDDSIVQMLLGRISLLEEALRQLDS
ncbi:hypothetical protein DVH05_019668 [Phytophthora capsici]|nr:hypothetical protein DVH05_019668 [Phytophthora capsici]